jgi:hypothetical protein
MLTHSLFTDWIAENGLKVKNGNTRDIITIAFTYGTRSYSEELAKIKAQLEKDPESEYWQELYDICIHNKDKYVKMSADELREKFYTEGVEIYYGEQKYQYKFCVRSAGMAKKGSCNFIVNRLYKKAINFLRMGISFPKNDTPIVEMQVYSSLVTSTNIAKIEINPDNILMVDDVKSYFKTNVVSIEVGEDGHCKAVHKEDYELSNDMFDGEGLIDSSIFPPEMSGYILLRSHFCKMACLNTNIQQFYKDYFGTDYENAVVTDMFGVKHPAKSIKLITTPNAMKFMKFGISYDYWKDKVRELSNMFGIVKTSHPSKISPNVQRMSYQMVNALDINTMDNVIKMSVEYVNKLKTDIDVFIDYLKKNANFSNDYEALVALWTQNHEFERSEYFRQRKEFIIRTYMNNLKAGKLIQHSNNLTLFGSPYALLMHSVGVFKDNDPTFETEDGCIQCYAPMFDDGEYLAEFRSPFNGMANLGYLHNHYHPYFKKYFNPEELLVFVNTSHTDFEDRNNGSDFDSDSVYVTNLPEIVERAKYCYENYPTIVNNIPKSKIKYTNTNKNFAMVDNKLASAQKAIGESSNLAQIALTYSYNFEDDSYKDYVCILSVLAQAAIDSSKRSFNIDITDEIDLIKKQMNLKEYKYPVFWLGIRKGFSKDKINEELTSPMCVLYKTKFKEFKPKKSTLPMDAFFVKTKLEMPKTTAKSIEELIVDFSLDLLNSRTHEGDAEDKDYIILREDFDRIVERIRHLSMPNKYVGLMAWLIDRALRVSNAVKGQSETFKSKLYKNRSVLFSVLYEVNPDCFLKCFSKDIC